MDSNVEQIKKAIEIEAKYKYIDIRGKTKCFSSFIRSEIRKFIKTSSIPERWKFVLAHFEQYSMDTMPQRKKSIEYLINAIKTELKQQEEDKKQIDAKLNPFSSVTYVKGVGPKVAAILNKLGIFTASDLLFYLPRKHIDYSKRTLIKNLVEGENTTVFGYIKRVEAFTTPKGLGVVKVKIQDETGSFILNFFNKSNKYALERTKKQFPQGAGIIISGTVKINNYDYSKTLENVSYSIMSEDFLTKTDLNIGRIVPVYSLCENMNLKTLRKAIYNAIQLYKSSIVNVIPDYLIKKYDLLNKSVAIEQIHFPDSMEMLEKARYTLVFEEFFLIQLKLAMIRERNRI